MEKAYKTLKLVLIALIFVALLLGAKRLYDTLGSQVQLDTLATQSTQAVEAEGTEPEKQLAPDFTVYDLEGNPHKLSEYRGKPVILNFWATWCGYCKMEMPDFNEKYLEYGEDVHFMMVNVTDGNQETVETASAYVEKEGYSFPVYYDTTLEAAMTYPTSGLPVTFIIDAEGVVIAWQQGMMTGEKLQKGIDMVLQ